jgi:hypothetical protein
MPVFSHEKKTQEAVPSIIRETGTNTRSDLDLTEPQDGCSFLHIIFFFHISFHPSDTRVPTFYGSIVNVNYQFIIIIRISTSTSNSYWEAMKIGFELY